MRGVLMRERLPDRRRSWTQKVHIAGQSFFLGVGLYEDGRPGEVFIDASKEGTFVRGILANLSRVMSIALQYGATVDILIKGLKGLDYMPCGPVEYQEGGSGKVKHCDSVTDWIAQELEAEFVLKEPTKVRLAEGDPLPEKVAGRVSEPWRTGA